MHQHRRRKKRPSYGVRTVEISRGKNGFGFTISGQAPCILSCIVTGSPAEKAGLRPGDFLIAVNGQNVSKAPHDDVVRLIGNSTGVLKLQIAENYYSDSSEEEFVTVVKPRPKYPYRIRNRQQQSVSRAEKVVRDLQTGALFVDHIHGSKVVGEVLQKRHQREVKNASHAGLLALTGRSNKALLDLILQQRLKESNSHSSVQGHLSSEAGHPSSTKQKHQLLQQQQQQGNIKKKDQKVIKNRSQPQHLNNSSSAEVFHSIFTEQDLNNILYPSLYLQNQSEDNEEGQDRAILRAVVGYLGTIEMPKEHQLPNSRLQTIRSCIRRLRIEKKVHTLVLLSVFTESVVLTNPHGLTLAEFPAEKITFSGVYADDKKFFGLVTNHGTSSDELSEGSQEEPISISSSCHVFMVDPKLLPHHQHLKRAKAFHISCTPDPVTNKCQEFPESADAILQAIVGLYRSRLGLNVDAAPGVDFHVSMSPQPSNTSSNSNSSNSDSGIGFRDEGNTSDRVFIVDVDNYHHYSTNSLDRQSFAVPGFVMSEASLRTLCLSQEGVLLPAKSHSQNQNCENAATSHKSADNHLDRLTVRAMPDPVGFDRANVSFNTERLEAQCNPTNIRNSVHKYMQIKQEATHSSKSNQNSIQSDEINHPAPAYCSVLLPSGDSKQSTSAAIQAENIDLQSYKLSPKVYGLNFPPKSLGMLQTQCSSGIKGQEYTSRSMEELHVSPPSDSMSSENKDFTEQEKKHEQEDGCQHILPSTLEDGDSESDLSEVEHGLEATKKWVRTSSLRRHLGRKRSLHRNTHEAGTVSDGEIASGKVSTSSSMLCLENISDTTSTRRSSCNSERPVDVSRVGSWAAGFDKLLEDPAGLHTFTEFLKKEFSQENITFWVSCEKYGQLTNQYEMVQMAKEIFSKHLCVGAMEPVNVDSHARQVAQEGLDCPSPDLFSLAQKQIFNLMKFDCYQRFLKSSLFKECMMLEMQGHPLPFPGEEMLLTCIGQNKMKNKDKGKGKDETEEKKRRSLLPWHRLSKMKPSESKPASNKFGDRRLDLRKSLKKKKKGKEIKETQKSEDISSAPSDLTGSRSSLASNSEPGVGLLCKNVSSRESLNSAELAMFSGQYGRDGCYLCRVVLPDSSTTVIRTQKGESLGNMLQRLMERRSLNYTSFEAYLVGCDEPLDQTADVASLGCKEIRVEQVVLFCLDLPNKKTIGVKAKPGKLCGEVLGAVLHKYGYKMDQVAIIIHNTYKQFMANSPITTIDSQRVSVQLKEDHTDCNHLDREVSLTCHTSQPQLSRTLSQLEEVTNQIFEDLLKGKSQFQFDELGILDLDQTITTKVNNSELPESQNKGHSFIQRIDQGNFIKNNKCKQLSGSRTSISESMELRTQLPSKALLPVAVGKGSSKVDTEEMLALWNRAHTSHVVDQQNTQINFEAPELLQGNYASGKENCLNSGNRVVSDSGSNEKCNLAYSNLTSELNIPVALQCLEHRFGTENILPTTQQAEEYFSAAFRCHTSLGFGESSSAEKFFRKLGILQSSHLDLKNRPVLLPPCLPPAKLPQRPVTHPLPRPQPCTRPQTRSLPLCSQETTRSSKPMSPTNDLENTLIGSSDNLDLDLDIDITLKVQSLSDDSLSPSRIPLPPDVGNASLHVEEANYPPPPPLEGATKELFHMNMEVPFSQPPLRRLSCEPPPIPPKAQPRGPPPRPPSRQLVSITPTFCQTSDDNTADEDSTALPGAVTSGKNEQKVRTKHYLCLDKDGVDFNISFV